MTQLIGSAIIGQSGGPTSVINASAYGVIRTALDSPCITKVYGAAHGIRGVLDDVLYDMGEEDPYELSLLLNTPSSALGSCRYKLKDPDVDDTDYQRILEIFKKYNVRYFFYNGGNDSMDTCNKISKYMQRVGYECRVMGVPKTIDNDLPITDHCPGYASACKYIGTSIKEIIRDNESFGAAKPTVVVVEIMGRHAGWLTAAAALAKGDDCTGCDAIYLPERTFDLDAFMAKVKYLSETKRSVVIAVSEGIATADGKFVCEAGGAVLPVDAFGHKQLGGTASNLCRIIAKETGLKARAIEFSTLQRAGSHIASLTDINEAFAAGRAAAKAAAEGKTAMMPVFQRVSQDPYLCNIDLHDIHDIANVEKAVPDEYITEDGCGITDAYIDYARPLIMGELEPVFVDGLPRHLVMEELAEF